MKNDNTPLTVVYVGMGGYMDTPCYKDEAGNYYFDNNDGKNGLCLYDGAYMDEDCGEICGEPCNRIDVPVICEEPFIRSPYEFQYMYLNKLKLECDYFLGFGNRSEKYLSEGSAKATCDAIEKLFNEFPDSEKPEWLTYEQIQDYRARMSA